MRTTSQPLRTARLAPIRGLLLLLAGLLGGGPSLRAEDPGLAAVRGATTAVSRYLAEGLEFTKPPEFAALHTRITAKQRAQFTEAFEKHVLAPLPKEDADVSDRDRALLLLKVASGVDQVDPTASVDPEVVLTPQSVATLTGLLRTVRSAAHDAVTHSPHPRVVEMDGDAGVFRRLATAEDQVFYHYHPPGKPVRDPAWYRAVRGLSQVRETRLSRLQVEARAADASRATGIPVRLPTLAEGRVIFRHVPHWVSGTWQGDQNTSYRSLVRYDVEMGVIADPRGWLGRGSGTLPELPFAQIPGVQGALVADAAPVRDAWVARLREEFAQTERAAPQE